MLVDTRNKIELFKNNIKSFIDDYKNNRILFLDKNHKKAIENRLGLSLIIDNEVNMVKKLYQIVDFLESLFVLLLPVEIIRPRSIRK